MLLSLKLSVRRTGCLFGGQAPWQERCADGEKQTAGEGPSLCYSLAVCQTVHANSLSVLTYKMRMITPTSLGVGSLKYIYEVAGPGEGEALTDATLTAFREGLPGEAQGWLFNSTLMIW